MFVVTYDGCNGMEHAARGGYDVMSLRVSITGYLYSRKVIVAGENG
jgi:hypothetical protein